MKYCKKCKRIILTDKTACSCGRTLTDNFSTDVPCESVRLDEGKSVQAAALLDKAHVPYSDVTVNKVQMLFGSVTGDHIFYVPFCFLKKSVDTLAESGLIEKPDYYEELVLADVSEREWKELSPVKQKIVRALSIVCFAVLIYICVAGVDLAAAFIKGLFV